jgi:Xaa-Pro aminopeptidase
MFGDVARASRRHGHQPPTPRMPILAHPPRRLTPPTGAWRVVPLAALLGAFAPVVLAAQAPAPSAAVGGGDAVAAARRASDSLAAFLRQPNPWPAIRAERVRRLLPGAMARAGVDAWVLLARENANDPLAAHLAMENAGGAAAAVVLRTGDRVRTVAISPVGEALALRDIGLHDSVHVVPRGADIYAETARLLAAARPSRIAINASERRAAADGLSATQRAALERALAAADRGLPARLVSSEQVVVEWLAVKLPGEVAVMRDAARLTEALEVEAYAAVVPGRTTDADVARYLKARIRELGVEDGWSPTQNPNVVSGSDRGHSHATDRVIRPGDVIQTDFGIKVFGTWVTDIQRFAYVLQPGETTPPAAMQRRWGAARRGSRAAFAAMRPGATGRDVDLAQRQAMQADRSLPVMWSTGHPVGYWAHDVGPALRSSGVASPADLPEVERVLRPGMVFAFDGFHSWPLPAEGEGATKTISVEEMVVVTDAGAEWLTPPQEELILIGPGGHGAAPQPTP